MTIRKAKVEDLSQLAKLFDAYRIFYQKPSNIEEAKIFLQKRMEKNESVIFIAEATNQTLCGFVQLYPIFSSTQMKRTWLLNDLFVSNEFRGKRVAVLLIDRAKQLARDTHAAGLMLETEKSNVIGNQLYPKVGFTLDKDHNYYNWDV